MLQITRAALAALFITMMSVGCLEQQGVQGGDLATLFVGLESAEAISPTSVRLTWTLERRFVNYKIYKTGLNSPVKEESFSTTVVSGLTPNTDYGFSVTGVDKDGKEVGLNATITIRTLPDFIRIGQENLDTTKSVTRVDLNWYTPSPLVTYKLFTKIGDADWDFVNPMATIVGGDTYSATGLTQGTKHCFFLRAYYLDGSMAPATDAELNSVLPAAPCSVTGSDMQAPPAITIDPVVPGGFPWFVASQGADTHDIDIFDSVSQARVAARKGNGPFRSFTNLAPGKREFYAIVTDARQAPIKQARIPVYNSVGDKVTQLRSLQQTGSQGPIFPRLISGGLGVQSLGSKTAMGDFNCDGLMDVAVSAPSATPKIDSNYYAQMGSVIVYYQELVPPGGPGNEGSGFSLYRFNTEITPTITASYPKPLLIYYPASGENYQFGSQMTVGNFNGDCRRARAGEAPNFLDELIGDCYGVYKDTIDKVAVNSALTDKFKVINSCDDLAIATNPTADAGVGSVFVVYGNSRYGLVAGSGGQNYGLNERTCDPFSGTCRTVKLTPNESTVLTRKFGRALASGDYDNDGYDDLAVSSLHYNTGANTDYYGKINVLRGSSRGLFQLVSDTAGGRSDRWPAVKAENSIVYGTLPAPKNPAVLGAVPNSDGFGAALGTAYNSRLCEDDTAGGTAPTWNTWWNKRTDVVIPNLRAQGYDISKCDDLVIGDPSRRNGKGSIVLCRGRFPKNLNLTASWDCQEHFPADSTFEDGAAAGYGTSILGVRNPNGIPVEAPFLESSLTAAASGIVGGFFVGAPYATVNGLKDAGMVFGYYNSPKKAAEFLSPGGGIMGVLANAANLPEISHDIDAVNSIACDRTNIAFSTGRCKHQLITSPAPQSGAQFGRALGTIEDAVVGRSLSLLAVSAPYQNVLSSNGSKTVVDSGAAFVFYPDLSVLGTEPTCATAPDPLTANVPRPQIKTPCTGTEKEFFGGGISPFTASLVYPRDLASFSNFGLGGIVGAQLNGTGPSDLFGGAPYHNSPVADNGALYMFAGSGTGFSPTETSPTLTAIPNISKELKYRFDTARVVGDVNGDGYDDAISSSLVGTSRVELVLFYGSVNGLISSPTATLNAVAPQPTLILSTGDTALGRRFFPIGSVNGDSYDDVLIIGDQGSYVYYGSATGLITSTEPSVSPVGKNPLLFGLANGACSTSSAYVTPHCHLWSPTGAIPLTRTGSDYAFESDAVSYGDFNGDGIGDFAMGLKMTSEPIVPFTPPSTVGAGTTGRVLILYGSSRGPQLGNNPGFIRLYDSTDGDLLDVVNSDPCVVDNSVTPPRANCKIQYFATYSLDGKLFGWALEGVPPLESGGLYSGLLVSDPEKNTVSYYKGSGTGLAINSGPIQTIKPFTGTAGNNYFGTQVMMAGDINGDRSPELLITAPSDDTGTPNDRPGLFLFYSGNFSGVNKFSDWTTTPPVPNERWLVGQSAKTQWILAGDITSTSKHGFGAAAVGDFNADGYGDILVNVAAGDYVQEATKIGAGYATLYFGSPRGLRAESSDSTTPECHGGPTEQNIGTFSTGICQPYRIYLPSNSSGEGMHLSKHSVGRINGDTIPDIILGGVRRDHPSGSAFATGVVYVLY